jgi:thiopurine S-methyltransferase
MMEADFWHDKWEANQIGFHKAEANPLLIAHFPALGLAKGARVFVPLCGKTLDIPWLLAQGMRVAGAELSTLAVEQLFEDMGVTPEVAEVGALKRYSAEGVDIYAGDIFDLTAAELGGIDAVYDRAALVALPDAMRARYAAHLAEITGRAQQLVICFEYDQSKMNGPPFSVSPAEVERVHGAQYSLTALHSGPMAGGLKGVVEAEETVWLLR